MILNISNDFGSRKQFKLVILRKTHY